MSWQLRNHLGCPHPVLSAWVPCQLHSQSILLITNNIHYKKQEVMTNVFGSLTAMWKIQIKFLAPCSGLAKVHHCKCLSQPMDG